MNEHPGVQPVVIEPDPSAARSSQVLPRNAKDMPVGLSANAAGLGSGQDTGMRHILFYGVPIAALLAIAFGTWLFVRSLEPLVTKGMVNGVYQYSFLFYKDAEPANFQGGQGFRYDDRVSVVAGKTPLDVYSKCAELNTKKQVWQEALSVDIQGVQRPVCKYQNIYMVTFFGTNQSQHMMQVVYDDGGDEEKPAVQKIMQSVKVSLE